MSYSKERLQRILERTDYRCHLCRKTLYLEDYGETWEVDHSRPRAKGGTDSLRNLYAACKSCNRAKQADSSRNYRKGKGFESAPLSSAKRKGRAARGAGLGLAAGTALGNPLLGGVVGWLIGRKDPR